MALWTVLIGLIMTASVVAQEPSGAPDPAAPPAAPAAGPAASPPTPAAAVSPAGSVTVAVVPAPAAAPSAPPELTGTVSGLEFRVGEQGGKTVWVVPPADGGAPADAGERGTLHGLRIDTDAGDVVQGALTEADRVRIADAGLELGDRIGFVVGEGGKLVKLRKIPGGLRVGSSLAAGFLAFLALAWVVLRGRPRQPSDPAAPWSFLVGEDHRYSASKTQIGLWFGILVAVYLAAVWLRSWASFGDLVAGIGIPANLLMLSGVSVLTFAGAKGIKRNQVAAAKARHRQAALHAAEMQTQAAAAQAMAQAQAQAGPESGASAAGRADAVRRATVVATQAEAVQQQAEEAKVLVTTLTDKAVQASFPADLVRDNQGNPDLASFQMLAVTVLAVGTYLWTVVDWLAGGVLVQATGVSLPDVDTTILAAFGLGQGAYLTKKYADEPAT